MKKIFVLMIYVLTSQNASAAEILPADIEYRYEGPLNSGSFSHEDMVILGKRLVATMQVAKISVIGMLIKYSVL